MDNFDHWTTVFIREKLGVDPSEFKQKTVLWIWKQDPTGLLDYWKEEVAGDGGEGILDSLCVADQIDVDCSVPSCELCGEEFTNIASSDGDKSVHLVQHFRDHILRVSTDY